MKNGPKTMSEYTSTVAIGTAHISAIMSSPATGSCVNPDPNLS